MRRDDRRGVPRRGSAARRPKDQKGRRGRVLQRGVSDVLRIAALGNERDVDATRRVEFIWPMSAAITVNGFSWAAYGFASNDWFLFSPNAFGGVVGVVQLVFLATFSKEKKQKKTRGTDGMEMDQRRRRRSGSER